jgi:hypothetical protein
VLVLVMAFGAAATGHAPLGGGRTDMWWYPAAWCLSAIVLEDLLEAAAPRLRAISGASKKALFASSVAVAIAMAVPFGIHFRAWYPHQNLRALITNNRSQILPSDWVYVAHTITFAWAFYELGPFHIVFDSSSVHTEQGWSVSVDKFNVQHVLTNDPAAVCRRTKRIWWIGSNPYASNPNNYRIVGPLLQQVDQVSPPFSSLLGLGWHRTGVVVGDGVNAQLFKHPGACT